MMQNLSKVHKMTLTAILAAIIFLLAFTPLGYLTVGPISATTIQMPVIIGAVLMGPASGALLGGFFGLSAIIKVLTVPGADPFATTALAYAPLNYILVCMVSRIIMGWLTGLLAAFFQKMPPFRKGFLSALGYGITGFVGSLLNTVFYLGLLWLLCAQVISTYYGVDLSGVGSLVMTTAWAAGIPEAIVSCIVVTAVCKALSPLARRQAAI